MPQAEYLSWQAYAQVEPFGSHFDDLRAGIVAAAVYNVNRNMSRHPEPFRVLDFTPWNAQHGRCQDRADADMPIEAQEQALLARLGVTPQVSATPNKEANP